MSEGQVEQVPVLEGSLWTCTTGAGPPVVMCHGGPGAVDYLRPLADSLNDVASVHRFDQRGGGRSRAGPPFTVARLVADMEILRRHWGHERWVVIGHSWGAHLALFYALAHPTATRALVLLNPTGLRWGWGPERRANRLPRLSATEQAELKSLEAALSAREDPVARARLRALMWLTDFADRKIAERIPAPTDQPDPEVVASLEHDWRLRLAGIEAEVAACRVPTLVMHGDADPIGERGPRALAQLLPAGRFLAVKRVGHLPWLEDPRGLAQPLRAFLSDHDALPV